MIAMMMVINKDLVDWLVVEDVHILPTLVHLLLVIVTKQTLALTWLVKLPILPYEGLVQGVWEYSGKCLLHTTQFLNIGDLVTL